MTPPVADRLFDLAVEQAGVFTARQAAAAGLSKTAIARAKQRHEIIPISRGLYELRRFPATRDTELWAAVLLPTTVRERDADLGVLSHDTALAYHFPDSDLAPARIHVTAHFHTPPRRFIPPTIALHFGNVPELERSHTDAGIPVTNQKRTAIDCLRANVGGHLAINLLSIAVSLGQLTQDEFDSIVAGTAAQKKRH